MAMKYVDVAKYSSVVPRACAPAANKLPCSDRDGEFYCAKRTSLACSSMQRAVSRQIDSLYWDLPLSRLIGMMLRDGNPKGNPRLGTL
jgi:hypothetical protein